MTVVEYIVNSLQRHGVTDVFGIPGGVILDLLYAFDAAQPQLTPHLMYHEQDAGFAACGYAQANGRLGVAYATKGPGFTNLITPIAEAYYESLPVLFITAHSSDVVNGMRTMSDQEMDTCAMVDKITKCAMRLDNAETFVEDYEKAIQTCLNGRRGPVLLDISTVLWRQEVEPIMIPYEEVTTMDDIDYAEIARIVSESNRPVILAGDGIVQASAIDELSTLVSKMDIPVISSRATHYLLARDLHYMGYIGSHGMRSANFVLAKADLIIAIGNRMHYPVQSKTYQEVMNNKEVLRFDIDPSEFKRNIPNSQTYMIDAKELMSNMINEAYNYGNHAEWNKVCHNIKEKLNNVDCETPIPEISSILRSAPLDSVITCDVGNLEFLVSRASVWSNSQHRICYSKAFGALGNALGKAIGVYYTTRKPVLCFVGDQGLQMNSQELQYVSQHQLPITIIVLNNEKSGMIHDREKARYDHPVHTCKESGYGYPNWKDIACAYGMSYGQLTSIDFTVPTIVELCYEQEKIPYIPQGVECQNMCPFLPADTYEQINML